MKLRNTGKECTIFLLSVFLVVSLFTSCGDSEPMKIEIDSINWDFRNLDPAFEKFLWEDDIGGGCYLSFTLVYYGAALQSGDLVSYTVESADEVFEISVEEDILFDSSSDENKHYIHDGYIWRNTKDPHSLSLGPWTFTLTFRDGSQTVKTITFPKPGTTHVEDNTYIKNEDEVSTDTEYYQMIKRASIDNAYFNTDTNEIVVSFRIDDSQARSGSVIFYDNYGKYIFETDLFVDSYGTVDTCFEDGFNTDGKVNVYKTKLSKYSDAEINTESINFAVINLLDGKQYDEIKPDEATWFDCMSFSAQKRCTP